MLYKHRFFFDLGFSECSQESGFFESTMGEVLTALAVEVVVDIASMSVQSRQG